MERIELLRFVSGIGVGLLVGWGLAAFGMVPSGGWPQWMLVAAGLALMLAPAFLLSRRAESSVSADRGSR